MGGARASVQYFSGTDTSDALFTRRKFYTSLMRVFEFPQARTSTIDKLGRGSRDRAYRNMLPSSQVLGSGGRGLGFL